jgi:hypothetical protein
MLPPNYAKADPDEMSDSGFGNAEKAISLEERRF